MKNLLTLFLIFACMSLLRSQDDGTSEAFEAHVFTSSTGDSLPYRVLWPEDYQEDSTKLYPLVLFLHGAGERGDDNALQLTHGSRLFLANRADFPAIVVMPQCPTDDYWAQMVRGDDGKRRFNFGEKPNPGLGAVMELLENFRNKQPVDQDRIYLMGLSMGGMGTFELLARKPDTFAAAIPICGGTNPGLLALYANKVPLWIFHGAADKVVDVEQSRRIVAALEKLGVSVRYTEYAGIGHNSWDPAFAEAELLHWLFSQKKELKE